MPGGRSRYGPLLDDPRHDDDASTVSDDAGSWVASKRAAPVSFWSFRMAPGSGLDRDVEGRRGLVRDEQLGIAGRHGIMTLCRRHLMGILLGATLGVGDANRLQDSPLCPKSRAATGAGGGRRPRDLVADREDGVEIVIGLEDHHLKP
jgi:hypothetical protein